MESKGASSCEEHAEVRYYFPGPNNAQNSTNWTSKYKITATGQEADPITSSLTRMG